MLDVCTDRESLLEDPLYLGYRNRRVRGERYRAFIDNYVSTALRVYPNALLHWEDLGASNARYVLNAYRSKICTFNDDIQGTASIVLAAVLGALKVLRGRLRDQRFVIFGAGTAGCGIADLIADAMTSDALSQEEAARQIWCVDRGGLLVEGMPGLYDFQKSYARPASEVAAWQRDSERGIALAEVVRHVAPTVLIGSSGVTGAFDEATVRQMARGTPRPIILPLSNPTALAEAEPANLVTWSEGKALIATGSPFSPVVYDGVTYVVAQANNAMIFPGLGLGTIVTRARLISDGMFAAAAAAIAGLTDAGQLGAPILPPMERIRDVSVRVAVAVASQALHEGLARVVPPDIEAAVLSAMWKPHYRHIEAI
jgi:malate dehydrogenase (oxaloacetate-decarboxylating)